MWLPSGFFAGGGDRMLNMARLAALILGYPVPEEPEEPEKIKELQNKQ